MNNASSNIKPNHTRSFQDQCNKCLLFSRKKIRNNVQNNSARTAAIYLFSSVLRFWLKTLQLARDAAEKLRFHSVGWLRHIFMDFKCSFSVSMSIEFCGSETFTCSVLWEEKWGWERGKKMRSLVWFPLPLQTNRLIRGKMRWWQITYTVECGCYLQVFFGLLFFYCPIFQKPDCAVLVLRWPPILPSSLL